MLPVPNWLHSILHQIQLGNVPAWASAIIAGWGAWSAWRSSRKSKTAETEAKTQAERSVGAAERAAEAAQRQATLAEKHAAQAEQEAAALEAAPWNVYTRNGNDYYLQNLDHTPKYQVSVSGTSTFPTDLVNWALEKLPKSWEANSRRSNKFDVVDEGSPKILRLLIDRFVDRQVVVSWYPTKDGTGDPLTQTINF